MSIEQDIHTYLSSKPSITNLIGQCIYVARRPSHAPAVCLTIKEISHDFGYLLSGEEEATVSVIQYDCWAKGPGAAKQALAVSLALKQLISGFRGTMGSTYVHGCTLERRSYTTENPADGTDYHTHRVSIDARMTYDESVPVF